MTGPELGAFVIDALLDRARISPEAVQAAYLGVGMVGSATLTPVRQAVLLSRLPNRTPSLAVDRACCSGMTAIGLAYKDILAGASEVVICGGFDSLSGTPLFLPRARERLLGVMTVDDPLLLRGQVVKDSIASYTAEEALRHGIDRAAQDAWAARSHERYFAADAAGYFDFERIAVPERTGSRGRAALAKDESPRPDTSPQRLAALATVHGSRTITAGNAPGLNDGAAALLVMEEARARDLGLPVLARLLDYAQVSDGPTSGSYTPAAAIEVVLKRHSRTPECLDLIEINEAFAATPLVSTLKLAGDDADRAKALRDRTNVHGGAVAIGHPLGASGGRLAMTLIAGLHRRGGGIGAAAICGGFGQGDSILLEVRS
jgi:acetyl-CoA C-acetyltransferase